MVGSLVQFQIALPLVRVLQAVHLHITVDINERPNHIALKHPLPSLESYTIHFWL
jgi:hypothetical protein